jgi:hypothetical protein
MSYKYPLSKPSDVKQSKEFLNHFALIKNYISFGIAIKTVAIVGVRL